MPELKARTESPEWERDDFDLTNYDIEIYCLWSQSYLPIDWKTKGLTMRQFKEDFRKLCLEGGECWPGVIQPLKEGQSYAVYFNPKSAILLAVVGLPEPLTKT